MKRVIYGAVVALLSALLFHPVLAASSEVGVVLMHSLRSRWFGDLVPGAIFRGRNGETAAP